MNDPHQNDPNRDDPSRDDPSGNDPEAANVVLTGFMGTGKTTVGRLLAELLGFEFVDTDAVIEQRHGSIASIFRERGEQAFRRIERDLAEELSRTSRLVISTGGRMLLDPRNEADLGRHGRVFCLVARADTIAGRVVSDASGIERPLLAGSDPLARISELLAEREPWYRRFVQIDTDDRPPGEIAAEIAALVRSGNRSKSR